MRTLRDNQILRFIESHRAITVKQCTSIFFEGNYRGCARRLQELEEFGYIESHVSKDTRQKTYQLNGTKFISEHDLYILDFYAWICEQGGEVLDFQKTPHYFNGLIIPDGLFKFKIPYQGSVWTIFALLEIDYTHYTAETKLSVWYEKLCREQVLKEYCGQAEFPFLVVARPTKGLRYNSKNFNIIYTDLKFSNILQLMLD